MSECICRFPVKLCRKGSYPFLTALEGFRTVARHITVHTFKFWKVVVLSDTFPLFTGYLLVSMVLSCNVNESYLLPSQNLDITFWNLPSIFGQHF